MGDMKDWVEDAAPLVDKQRADYADTHRMDVENNELLKEMVSQLHKLNTYMQIITGEEL